MSSLRTKYALLLGVLIAFVSAFSIAVMNSRHALIGTDADGTCLHRYDHLTRSRRENQLSEPKDEIRANTCLCHIGYSHGGYESLAVQVSLRDRTLKRNNEHAKLLIRLQVGLEGSEDLIADLERGFAAART